MKIVHEQPFSEKLDDFLLSSGVTPRIFGDELMDMIMELSQSQLEHYVKMAEDGIMEWDTDKIIKRILSKRIS